MEARLEKDPAKQKEPARTTMEQALSKARRRRPAGGEEPPGAASTPGGPRSVEDCPLMLTCEEVAEILDCHVVTVRQWCSTGMLPAVKIGRRWYVTRETLLGR